MHNQFFECNGFCFQTIALQPEAFIGALSASDLAKLKVACEGIANAFVDGSPPVRSRLARGAKLHDLFVIYVDWPWSPGPTRMLLGRRVGSRVLVARGLKRSDGDIPKDEVKRAERALAEAEDDGATEGGA
ncbi:MAG TPA: hypothetical protein VJL81_04555 [Solirubrobacterales bacterium]|nr:hypothetical protein [Solirubrobacterales bacterium]